MVHLFRGIGGRGRGFPRPPVMMLRHMRPQGYESDFIPPCPYGLPRGNFFNRPPIRPRPMPPPRMVPPPRLRPPPPHPPLRDMHYPPIHLPGRHLGIPPLIPPGPPLRRPMQPQPSIRGRGGFTKRGVSVKRLVPASGRAKKNQNRKEKTEGAFFCETCDRGWNTEEKLQEHVAQHQVCGREGCTFTAHPKVVLNHIQMQHDSGLYNRISTEDVAKWIAERKSRFPTKQNVEKKEAQMNEMLKRGERIPSQGKRFQTRQDHGNWRDKRQRTNENNNNNKSEVGLRNEKPQPRKLKPCEGSHWRDPDAWRGDLPQFPGTAAFPPEAASSNKDATEEKNFSDDDEWTEGCKIVKTNSVKPVVSSILASLMANYGSDMSDEDEENDTVLPKIETCTPVIHTVEKRITKDLKVNIKETESPAKLEENNKTERQDDDSDSAPEECAIDYENKLNLPIPNGEKSKEQVLQLGVNNKDMKQLRKDENRDISKIVPVRRTPMKSHQLSLLEKLLKNEIRHERNAILQCVRYVVKNNFLGCGNIGQPDSIKS